MSSPLSSLQEWRSRRAQDRSREPQPLIEREPSTWPWWSTAYLAVLVIAGLVVAVPEHCAGDWGFARAAQAGAILAPLIDGVLIGRRRGSWSLAAAVAFAAIATCGVVLWFVFLLRGGAANCFD